MMFLDITQTEEYKELDKMYNELMTSTLYYPSMEMDNGYWTLSITYQIGNPVTGNFLLDMSDGNWRAEKLLDEFGYVYEAVPSNRLEGVTATCYYKDSIQNAYGDWEVREVLWDAGNYDDQANPQLTNAEGRYGWDVPIGLWQVRYQKDGYEAARSEWLPVPPPQLEVNIPMVQRTAPDVTNVHAYQDGVELTFSKYMQPATLTPDNLKVKVVHGGKETFLSDIMVVLLNEEAAGKGSAVTYASRLRLTSETGWKGADEVVLIVDHSVKSYCGVRMQETFMQRLDVEQRIEKIAVSVIPEVSEVSEVSVHIGGARELKVTVTPAEAAVGKMLCLTPDFDEMVELSTTEAVLDANGQPIITLMGTAEGSNALMLTIDGYEASTKVTVEVTDPANMALKMPVATPASGTVLNAGDTVTLTTYSEGAQIYYTTDGSCSCDEQGTRKLYTAPFVITGQTVLKALVVKDGWTDSEIATFVYVIKGDVNGDVAIDVVDIATIISIMAGTAAPGAYSSGTADVNGDGVVDVADIAATIDIKAANARRLMMEKLQ